MHPNRLLVVDDETEICAFVKDAAEGLGFDVAVAHSCGEFRQTYAKFCPSVVVLDLKMPGEDGVELMSLLSEYQFEGRTVITSGFDAKVLNSAARLAGSYNLKSVETLQKPIMLPHLEKVLRGAYQDDHVIAEDDLKRAIEAEDFELHYQPKIYLRSDRAAGVHSVEALVRWRHERLGTIAPDDFIPMAERTGDIVPLTDIVLRQAMAQAWDWRKSGINVPIAVNLPGVLLGDPAFPGRLAAMLEEFGLPSSQFVLEVTESGVMADTYPAMESLTRLRLAGLQLSIDDFGTGNSSLVQLYRMPFSELKIDKSFIAELNDIAEAEIIVRSVIDLARNLGLSTCAEGVEDEATAEHLRALGCDLAQGYHYSRPVPAAEATTLLRNKLPLMARPALHQAAERKGSAKVSHAAASYQQSPNADPRAVPAMQSFVGPLDAHRIAQTV